MLARAMLLLLMLALPLTAAARGPASVADAFVALSYHRVEPDGAARTRGIDRYAVEVSQLVAHLSWLRDNG
jgi:hypothetical protein